MSFNYKGLPLNGVPAIVQAVKSLQAGGLHDIRVVVGYKSEQLIPLLQNQSEIVYPCYQGERGHPPLISSRNIPDILSWKEEGGLRAVLNRFEDYAVDIPVNDQGILLDMDTPKDYLRLCKYCRVDQIPSVEECEMLLDIAKGEHNYAQRGAERLADYPKVAEIVAAHMNIEVSPTEFPTEKEIIYLADKLVKKDQLAGLQSRFLLAFEKYKDDPQIKQKVLERLKNAQFIKEKIEVLLGMRRA